jgi:hypothetical protein
MVAIPILSGIYADQAANLRTSLPVNLEPNIVESGLSKGYLGSPPGIASLTTGPGADYGSIVWNGVTYRVMGTKLVSVSDGGIVSVLGDVGATGPVRMDYSFDRLAINAGNRLYYYSSTLGLVQVTDIDLGPVIDMVWVDGYFMTTDGQSLVVTELNDPFSVDPLKYGSSEEDPDPIVGLRKTWGEIYALNRNTIENFQDVGSTGFPFQRNGAGLIQKGCVGSRAHCSFVETFAFVGGGRNEQIGVYLAGAGRATKISSDEVDRRLAELTDAQQALIEVEALVQNDESQLWVHLPTQTLVYSFEASKQTQQPVWHVLASGANGDQAYVGRHLALSHGKWQVGSPAGQIGYLDQTVASQFNQVAGWKFETGFLYNASKGGIIQSLELVGLPGQAPFGTLSTAFLSMTRDGVTYSQRYAISTGGFGERSQRVQWRPRVRFSNYIGLRFQGANAAQVAWARLEADVEPLSV